MEKKSLSAVDISKKLIWEYIVASFIFGIISYFIIGFSTRNMENAIEKMILQINFLIRLILNGVQLMKIIFLN